jgi:hypothetical protein
MHALVDDLRYKPILSDNEFVVVEFPMDDKTKSAVEKFVSSRLLADGCWEREIPMSPLERRQLAEALRPRPPRLRRPRSCSTCVARRPRHRDHGGRRRGVGGRRRARDGDDDGGGDSAPDSPRRSRQPARQNHLALGRPGIGAEGWSNA